MNIDNEDNPVISVNILGGLGNQMFQLASAYAYARKYSGNLKIMRTRIEEPTWTPRPLYWNSILSRFNTYLVDELPSNLEQWYEPGPTNFGIIPPLSPNGIYLNGCLQSEQYFGDITIQAEIKELFKPSQDILSVIKDKYENLLENKERVIVVHARRTDYLRNQASINFHGPLSIEYYKEAIKRMSSVIKDPIILLSSDDPSFWNSVIEETPELHKYNVYILDNENEINTLALLQQFHYFIIANSTFSWWASWLSNDVRRVIAPSKWFGPCGPQNYKDIYLPHWEII
jgi:hypothetical protein